MGRNISANELSLIQTEILKFAGLLNNENGSVIKYNTVHLNLLSSSLNEFYSVNTVPQSRPDIERSHTEADDGDLMKAEPDSRSSSVLIAAKVKKRQIHNVNHLFIFCSL